jgi:hypothetical protein
MAIQQKLSAEQQVAYEAYKKIVQSLQDCRAAMEQIENELGVNVAIEDLIQTAGDDPDMSVHAFVKLFNL